MFCLLVGIIVVAAPDANKPSWKINNGTKFEETVNDYAHCILKRILSLITKQMDIDTHVMGCQVNNWINTLMYACKT